MTPRRARSPKSTPPAATVIASTARVLLEEHINTLIDRAGAQAEVHRIFARSYPKQEIAAFQDDVMSVLETPSLFSSVRVVVVWDGKTLLKEKSLQRWLQNPTPGTTLLLVFLLESSRAKPPAIPKGVAVEQTRLTAPANAAERRAWLEERLRPHGCTITAQATQLLEELVGDSLDRLAAQADKLSLFCGGGAIEAEHVEQLVGRSAGQDFDRLLDAAQRGSLAQCLGTLQTIAEEGLLMFQGGRIHGARQTAATLLPLLFGRIRKLGAVGAASGETRAALEEVLGMNPWYAKRLAREQQALGPGRLDTWVAAALAAEVLQKRIGGVPDDELLTLLLAEMAGPS